MSFLQPFHLPPATREHVAATGPSPPLELCLDLCPSRNPNGPDGSERTGSPCGDSPDNADSPETSTRKGSFHWDQEKGGFTLEWVNDAAFEMWRREEERIYSIEFISSTRRTGGTLWSQWQLFVCGRQDSGGGRTYKKKHPERQHKIGTRKSGCGCHIIVKQYPHTSTVLGRYVSEHDHKIGAANITYTRLSGATRKRIKSMLTQKIDRYEIVSFKPF